MNMYNVGNLSIEKGIFLAPMEDVSDMPFRRICRSFGADMVFTEFISSEGLRRNVSGSTIKINFHEEERPIGIQLFGNNAEALVAAAQIAQDYQPEVIDINWGCPVKKVAYKGGGSGALKDIENLTRITEAVVNAVELPVTVKTRLGYDANNIAIVELSEMLENIGVKALTIHGRTRTQMYKGEADWEWIGKVKSRAKIPIIGNGDILTAENVVDAFAKYKVDAVMIGRAAIGNPWLFRNIKHYMQTGNHLPEPDFIERVELLKKHLQMSLDYKKNERRTMLEMRRQITAYLKGVKGVAKLRSELMGLTKLKPTLEKLDKFATETLNNENYG